jgi:tetratricopeptide (TPR) repeat protein
MKPLAILFSLVACGVALHAQTVVLQNGQTSPYQSLVRQGDMLMLTVKSPTGGTGQVGYHVADVARIDQPLPAEIRYASALVAQGRFAQALQTITPVVEQQQTLRDIAGNDWAQAALVQVSALAGAQRLDEAKALVAEIGNFSKDPAILNAVKLQVTLATKFTDPDHALAAYDAILAASNEPLTASQAWLAEGDIHFGRHEYDSALLAYLTVAVFYPEHNPFLAKALWGAGQSYAKLRDEKNALKTFHQLADAFPEAPETTLAKAEIVKKDTPQ